MAKKTHKGAPVAPVSSDAAEPIAQKVAVEPVGVSSEQLKSDMAAHGAGRFAPPLPPPPSSLFNRDTETGQQRSERVRREAQERGNALAK